MKTVNRKTKACLVFLFSVALVAGCEKYEESFDNQGGLVPLQLAGDISVSRTRAYDQSWNNDDQIGVFTTITSSTTITTSDGTADANIPYKTTGGTNFTPASTLKQIYLPADGKKVDVYGYYPYNADVSVTTPLNITVEESQTTANQMNYDVLTAKLASTEDAPIWRDAPDVRLVFAHCLTKVLIRVIEGAGYNNELSGKISAVNITNQPTTATFDPISQQLTVTGTCDKSISPVQLTEVQLNRIDPDYTTTYVYEDNEHNTITKNVIYCYRAIVLPNDATNNPSGNSKIVFTVGDVTYNYNITESFDPGEQVTFTITLAATSIAVTAEITPWTNVNITPNPLQPQPST